MIWGGAAGQQGELWLCALWDRGAHTCGIGKLLQTQVQCPDGLKVATCKQQGLPC